MGGMWSVVKGLGAVGGLASKVGHCGHGVRQRTSHAPGAHPLQHSHEHDQKSQRRQIAGGGREKN